MYLKRKAAILFSSDVVTPLSWLVHSTKQTCYPELPASATNMSPGSQACLQCLGYKTTVSSRTHRMGM